MVDVAAAIGERVLSHSTMQEQRTQPSPADSGPQSKSRAQRWRALLVAGTGLIMTVLVIAQVPGVNGPTYWTWMWRRLATSSVYPSMGLAALPFFAGHYLYTRDPTRMRWPLALTALSAAALMLAGVTCMGGIERIVEIVINPDDVSYFTDAVRVAQGGQTNVPRWLARYPEMMPGFHLHTYLLLRQLTGRIPAAFHGASFLRFAPATCSKPLRAIVGTHFHQKSPILPSGSFARSRAASTRRAPFSATAAA